MAVRLGISFKGMETFARGTPSKKWSGLFTFVQRIHIPGRELNFNLNAGVELLTWKSIWVSSTVLSVPLSA